MRLVESSSQREDLEARHASRLKEVARRWASRLRLVLAMHWCWPSRASVPPHPPHVPACLGARVLCLWW